MNKTVNKTINRKKGLICIIVVLSMIFGLVGCGKDKRAEELKYVFAKAEDFERITGSYIGGLFVAGNVAYFCDTVTDSSTAGDTVASAGDSVSSAGDAISSKVVFYKKSLEGGETEKIAEFSPSEGDMIWDVFYDKDGNPYFVLEHKDKSLSVYSLDGDGFKENAGFASLIKNSADDHFKKAFITENGKIFSVNQNSFALYDSDFKKLAEESVGSEVKSAAMSKDGKLLIGCLSGESGTVKDVVKAYDPETLSFGNEIELDVDQIDNNTLISGAGKYDFYYDNGSVISGYKIDSKMFDKVFEYDSSDVVYGTLSKVCFMDENTFLALFSGSDTQSDIDFIDKYVHLDPKDVDSRIVLKLAVQNNDENVSKIVNQYNKSQTKYRIKVVDYSQYDDPEAKMSTDIAAGNTPDIYEVSDGIAGMTIDQCIKKGYLEDLTPYLEKDKKLSPDDFIQSAYNSMLRDGKLYFTASGFAVNYIIADKTEVSDGISWSYKEMKDYVLSKPEGTMMFYDETKYENLQNLMWYCYGDFVDWENGSCDFTSDEFKAVLELCNTGADEETQKNFENTSELLDSGTMLFLKGYTSPVTSFDLFDVLFSGNATIKGFPSKDGTGLYTEFHSAFAISKSCASKDAAWDFVRIPLTEDYEGHTDYGSVPLREDVYAEMVKMMSATESGKDKYGNEYMTMEGVNVNRDDISYVAHAFDEKDRKEFRTIIDSADSMLQQDSKIYSIIEEEAANYFSGNKTLDETCKVIQDRVSTYINESN